jgi:iron(III) transport system permease protein
VRRLPASYVPTALVAAAVLAPVGVLVHLAWGTDPALGGQAWGIAGNSIALTVLTVLGAVLLGVPLAFATTCLRLPAAGVWLVALAAPLAIPSYIGAFTWFAAFGPGGEIEALTGVGTPSVRGLLGASVVMALYTYPFVLLPTRAALRQLDGRAVDVARSLGMPLRMALLRVVLPRTRSGIAAGALLVALYTLSDFATPAILQVDTFTRVIFVEYNAFGLDRAALLSLQLLALVAVVVWLESRVGTERERAGRPLALTLPGRARTLVPLALGAVFALVVGLPLLVFGIWTAREGIGDFDPMLVWHSAMPSLLAAVGAVAVALPVAWAATHGRLGRVLERAATLGFGVPGIVMGTALVVVGLQLPLLYQTLALLVAAYVLRFLPLAVGALRTSAARLEGSLLGAARSLGASRSEAFRRVALPMMLPGVAAGGALVFLEAMRELPATLLLRPTGMETLTTELWAAYEAGMFGDAALPGLLLVGVSMIALALVLRGEGRIGT